MRSRPVHSILALSLAACRPSEPAPESTPKPTVRQPTDLTRDHDGYYETSDGARLHYIERGTGPAILFVPGWQLPAWIWNRQIEHFCGTHRVIALDPRAQGQSAMVSHGNHVERRARDLREIIEVLDLAPVTLVGWSLGGSDVLSYVEQFGTDSIAAVSLIDTSVFITEAHRLVYLEHMRQFQNADRRTFTDDFVRGMFATAQPEDYINDLIVAVLEVPVDAAYSATMSGMAVPRAYWPGAIEKLDRPLSFLVSGDNEFMKQQADLLRETKPDARVVVVEGTGHALFVDAPDRFNAALEGVLPG